MRPKINEQNEFERNLGEILLFLQTIFLSYSILILSFIQKRMDTVDSRRPPPKKMDFFR